MCIEDGIEEFGATDNPCVLRKTSAVLTIARRCVAYCYTFVWKLAQDPYVITTGGVVVVLEPKGYNPYARVGASDCTAFWVWGSPGSPVGTERPGGSVTDRGATPY